MAGNEYKQSVMKIKEYVMSKLREEPDKHNNVLSDGGRRLAAYLNLYVFTPLLNFKEDKPSPKELAARVDQVIAEQFIEGSRMMADLRRLEMSDATIHSVVKKQLEQFKQDYQNQYRPPIRSAQAERDLVPKKAAASVPPSRKPPDLPTRPAPKPPKQDVSAKTSKRDSTRGSQRLSLRESQRNMDAQFDDIMKIAEDTQKGLTEDIAKENRGSPKGGSSRK